MKTATIVGAGLVGSLWAVYLSKAGYKVRIDPSNGSTDCFYPYPHNKDTNFNGDDPKDEVA